MKTYIIFLTINFLFYISLFSQVQFCGQNKIDKNNDYCEHITAMIICADKSSSATKIKQQDRNSHQRTKDNLLALKGIIEDGIVFAEKEEVNILLNKLLENTTFCITKNNDVGKKNNEILITLKTLVDKNINNENELPSNSEEGEKENESSSESISINGKETENPADVMTGTKTTKIHKGINWFGWLFFTAFLISVSFHLKNYIVLHKLFNKNRHLSGDSQNDIDIKNMESEANNQQNDEIIRELKAELKILRDENSTLKAENLDLRNSSEVKNNANALLHEIYPTEEKMIDLPIEPSVPVKILFHHDIETDGKSLKVAKATNKQTPMSLYEIRAENDNNIKLWVIESPVVTKMLIDYSRKQLEPLFNIPSEPSPSVSLIKTKQPAIFKREGEIWVLDSKGSVEYI